MISIYPDIIKKVILDCLQYKLDVIDLYQLKNELWQAARNINEPSEKGISEELLYFESDLDEVQVTYEEPKKQKEEALKIIAQLEEKCYSWIELI
jgi:hypothetical protein